jgi:NADPH2:quinone reductase
MLVDASLAALKPGSLDPVAAATLPLVSITAWEALVERASIAPGDRVLIHGGAGGVGYVALQLAKSMGATVYTTVSTAAKAQAVRRLGADQAILYPDTGVAEYVAEYTGGEGFDVVFDTVGGGNLHGSFEAARTGGTVVSIAARTAADLSAMHSKALTLHVVFMLLPLLSGAGRERHGRILESIARLVHAGRIVPLIDEERFPMSRAAAAHEKLETGRAMGKIALSVDF